ncbi:PP2C family serine/threonine-protein phosphatase [Sphingomonas sp. Leaf25]|uniref:PP2C family serine/threonine-protein phosphatase n=1 Tax=Sphingomonas sp. Leaf25 TaxID=1735692 RepID=UPI0006F20998|nr:PP2C family serine/threonine-protein phosphatase [Sphingomonas sp. Leaf25]KQN01454.1 hypothetical protein ASE78_17405 [Sphingomonas sp. Leaf25]
MPDWTWAAASRRGTAHVTTGDGLQDAYRVLTVAGFIIAIACDGAGSTRYGRLGAVIATRVLSRRAAKWVGRHRRLPSPVMMEMWVAEVRLAIFVHADRRGCAMGAFAATLVLAISNGISTLTAHVGDGAVVAQCAGFNEIIALSWPESGQYASTTFFLTDDAVRLRIGIVTDIAVDRVAVLTDGLERLALDFAGKAAHAPFFRSIFGPVASSICVGRNQRLSAQLADFLSSDSVNARTDDDKTLVVAALR